MAALRTSCWQLCQSPLGSTTQRASLWPRLESTTGQIHSSRAVRPLGTAQPSVVRDPPQKTGPHSFPKTSCCWELSHTATTVQAEELAWSGQHTPPGSLFAFTASHHHYQLSDGYMEGWSLIPQVGISPKSYTLQGVNASGSSTSVSLGFREIQHFAAPVQPLPLNIPSSRI